MRLRSATLLGLLLATAAQGAAIEDYGALPSVDDVALSPDGKNAAYATDVEGKRAVLIVSLDDHKVVAAIKVGDQKLRDLNWADADHLLITVSTAQPAIGVRAPKSEWELVQSFSLSTREQIALLQGVPDAMNVVSGAPEPRTVDGRTLVFLNGIHFGPDRRGLPALFSIDLDSHRTRLVEAGDRGTEGWTIDENGNLVARAEYDEASETWTLKTHKDGDRDWRDTFSYPAPIETPDVVGITPDGSSLVLALPDADDKEVKLSDGTVSTSVDISGAYNAVLNDPATHRMIGTIRLGNLTTYRFFDPADQRAWNSVAAAFANENVELVSWSTDRKRIVVRVDGSYDGAVYELVDLNDHRAAVLGPVYKGIGPDDVSPVTDIAYRAADGRRIPAYLTLPKGRDPKNLPLIVLPHGGPAARDLPQFDWWAQALASRGYAVLQPQFRGSTALGWNFLAAGFGEWGRKMQTDLSDGVRELAAQGTIDPKRVCIAGASYGGYAALAGVTLQQGIYRCAVAVAGVSDPHNILEWERDRMSSRDNPSLRFWKRFMGAQSLDDPKLAEISPLAHAQDANVPILLIHGKDDTVVPISESENMADALRAAGKPARLVTLDGEDHWLSRPETRLRMLTETIAFLEANNPPN